MPIILAVIGLLLAGVFWYNRIRSAGQAAEELFDVAKDVRLAARRFGFKRRANVHPIDSVDDPRLAAAGIVAATAQMDGMWDTSMSDEMTRQMQSVFDVSHADAEEIVVFGRWIATQGGNPSEAIRRLTRCLKRLAGRSAEEDTLHMMKAVGMRGGRPLSAHTREAMDTVTRIFATP